MMKAFITGLHGQQLTSDEGSLLRDAKPCGIILFARNCDTPQQLRRLIDDAVEATGDERTLVLIDQEGGRVQRLRPPHWHALPPARSFAQLYKTDPERAVEAASAVAMLMGEDLRNQGITVDCAPVLDIPVEGAHEIIGDRAYGTGPESIIALGRAVGEGLMKGGVLPVIKHIPGHGRARSDSHLALPVIDTDLETLRATDFVPFKALNDMPLAMTAHVLLTAIDQEQPATLSRAIMSEMIRGEIGFDGLVMTDDLSMHALTGSFADRVHASIEAGVDVVLHCNGDFSEMVAVAEATPTVDAKCNERFERALSRLKPPQDFDRHRAEHLLGQIMDLS